MEKHLISTLLYTEKLKGVKIHKLNGDSIEVFEIPRNLVKIVSDLENVSNYGIYFLIDDEHQSIYIGQTDNLVKRINEHNSSGEKEFQKAILFTDENNNWSKTYIDYLEYYYINELKKSNAYKMINSSLREKKPNVSKFEEPTLLKLIANIDLFLFSLGIEFNEDLSKDNLEIFHYNKSNLIYTNGKYKMLKDSIISNIKEDNILNLDKNTKTWEWSKARFIRMQNQIKIWLENNLIKELNEDEFVLLKDITFATPSNAAIFVNGKSSSNGWNCWKNSKGETLNEIYRK